LACSTWRRASGYEFAVLQTARAEGRSEGALVNGNWRVTFRFVGTDAELVDYQDYH